MVEVMYTLALNPYIGLELALVLQTAYLAFLVAFPEGYEPKSPRFKLLFRLARGLLGVFPAVFGVLFVDIAVTWLLGAWTFVDWPFQLPSVVLLLLLGIQYCAITMFRRGNPFDVAYAVAAVAAFVTFIHWWVPRFAVMGPQMEGGLPVVLGALVGGYVAVALLKVATLENPFRDGEGARLKYWWDARDFTRKVFSRRVNAVLWLFALVQGMLLYGGYSLLAFW
ncbi:MAG: hypothetical protein ACTSU5_00100 [Promethearchaeota archaeon]